MYRSRNPRDKNPVERRFIKKYNKLASADILFDNKRITYKPKKLNVSIHSNKVNKFEAIKTSDPVQASKSVTKGTV